MKQLDNITELHITTVSINKWKQKEQGWQDGIKDQLTEIWSLA